MDRTEIVIAGAGVNGLMTAIALAGRAVRVPAEVTVVDPGTPARLGQADGRALAITAAGCNMLRALDVWPALEPHAQPFEEIVVSDHAARDPDRPGLLHFTREHAAEGPSAWMMETQHIAEALHAAASAAPSITLKYGTAIADHRADASGITIDLDDGSTIRARLLVGADGRNSPVRQRCAIDTVAWPYHQSGIVTAVNHEADHGGRAEEHFLPAGPFAILPLVGGHRSSLVWTEETARAADIVALDDDAFAAELATRMPAHYGKVAPHGPRRQYPLALQVARSFIADRVALIGDAAHVVHPIAGLGFNLGIRDSAALAEVVGEALRLGLDIGGPAQLDAYQAWRRFDTALVAAATDGLNRLFSNDNQVLRALRDAGLSLVDRLGPAKHFFMREAAGFGANTPKLLNGIAV